MVHLRTIRFFVAVLMGLGLLACVSPMASAAHKSNGSGSQPTGDTGDIGGVHWSRYSDTEAQQMLIKAFGSKVGGYHIVHTAPWLGSAQLTSYVNEKSNVWAGYLDDLVSTPYYANQVSGFFTVPSYSSTLPVIGEWAGIGGRFGNMHLVQAGATTTLYNGYPVRAAFWQCYPANPVNLWVLSSGNVSISVHISLVPGTTTNWNILVTESDGTSEALTISNCSADRNSAEWIMERSPDSNGGAVPSNIGRVTFTYAEWYNNTGDGVARSIQNSEVGTVRAITFSDSKNGTYECLVPSGLAPYYTGSTFHVDYASHC